MTRFRRKAQGNLVSLLLRRVFGGGEFFILCLGIITPLVVLVVLNTFLLFIGVKGGF